MVKKTKKTYFLLVLANFVDGITTFDILMSKGVHDVFALKKFGFQNIYRIGLFEILKLQVKHWQKNL